MLLLGCFILKLKAQSAPFPNRDFKSLWTLGRSRAQQLLFCHSGTSIMIPTEPTDRTTQPSRLAGASPFQMSVSAALLTSADHNTTNQAGGMTGRLSRVTPQGSESNRRHVIHFPSLLPTVPLPIHSAEQQNKRQRRTPAAAHLCEKPALRSQVRLWRLSQRAAPLLSSLFFQYDRNSPL